MTSEDDTSCVIVKVKAGNGEDINVTPSTSSSLLGIGIGTGSTRQQRSSVKLRQAKLPFGSSPLTSSTPKAGGVGDSDSEDLLPLSMDEDEEGDGDGDYKPAPKKRKQKSPATPDPKKSTGKTPGAAGTSKPKRTPTVRKRKSKVPEFTTALRALSVHQLVDLIEGVVGKYPEIKNDFMGLKPLPDLGPLEKNLEKLKKAVYKAFPWTKWGSDRDAFCFRRVKTHLDTFQRECIEQGKGLIDLQQWKSSMDYTLIAWKYVGELPDWDDSSNNKHKEQCFKKLSAQYTNALKQGTFERAELAGYIEKFEKFTGTGMEGCVSLARTLLNNIQ